MTIKASRCACGPLPPDKSAQSHSLITKAATDPLFVYGKEGFDVLKFAFHEGGKAARDLPLFRDGLVRKDCLPLFSGDVVAPNLVRPQDSFLDASQDGQEKLFAVRGEG